MTKLYRYRNYMIVIPLLFSPNLFAISQDTSKITVRVSNSPIEHAIRQIEKQSGYTFLYGTSTLDDEELITVNLSHVRLTQALQGVFRDKPVDWQLKNKKIVLSKQQFSQVSATQSKTADTIPRITVSGVVLDKNGNPLPSSTVLVKGTSIGSSTGNDGKFSISNVPTNATLSITSIGYEPHQERLNARPQISIILKETVTNLNNVEIVSTGYENLNRQNTTGSFVQIDNKLYNRQVGANVLDRLYNVTSGLNFQRNTVGRQSPLSVRGVSTINANQEPLIVVDNFPYEGDINNLNPNDVESVTVLRDAAAASIWGVKAGNGVIVITTKRGRFNRQPSLQITSNMTVTGKPELGYVPYIPSTDVIDFQLKQFADSIYNEYDDSYPFFPYFPVAPQIAELLLAVRSNKISKAEADAQIMTYRNHDIKDDINKYLIQTGIAQQYAVNVSGGGGNYSYYASAGYDKNRGFNIGDKGDRLNLRFQNTFTINKLEIGGFLAYVQTTSNSAGLDYNSLLPIGSQVSPYTMLADASGSVLAIPRRLRTAYIDTASYPALLDWHFRPLDEAKNTSITNEQLDARFGANMKYTIIDGLVADVSMQVQKAIMNNLTHYTPNSYYARDLINTYMSGTLANPVYPIPTGGILDTKESVLKNWNIRSQLNYTNKIGVGTLSSLIGFESRQTTTETQGNRKYGYDDQSYTFSLVDPHSFYTIRPDGYQAMLPNTMNSSDLLQGTENKYISYYINGSYNYDERYIITGSGRIDKSNFFGVNANNRQVPLWSAGVAWNISNESFYRSQVLPYVKFRLSYGFNGNTNNGGNALTLLRYYSAGSQIHTGPSAAIISPPNPELRWEKMKIVNAGIDFGIKDQRIQGSLEYYHKDGIDLIGPIITDPTRGVKEYTGNNANMKVKGFDIQLSSRNLVGTFQWMSKLLLSYASDRVTAYGQKATTASQYKNVNTPIIGDPLYKMYSYHWAGLNPLDGNARIYLGDTISLALNYNKAQVTDLVYSGRLTPVLFGSMLNTFSYMNLELSVNISYKFGYIFRKPTFQYNTLLDGWGGNADYSLRWMKSGDETRTSVPALPNVASDPRYLVYGESNALIEKADHIRLQDVRLSYTLDKSIVKQVPFQSANIFLYATNIGFLWKANKAGLDPDYYSFGSIPPGRSITLGLNITL